MAHRIQLAALGALLLAACGVDIVGTGAAFDGGAIQEPTTEAGPPGPDASPDAPVEITDGGTIGDADAEALDACAASCTASALSAPGFYAVAIAPDRSAKCPDDLQAIDIIENPKAQAGACGCGACTSTGAVCNAATVSFKKANDNQCGMDDNGVPVANGNCQNANVSFSTNFLELLAPTPSNAGSCSASSTKDTSKVTATEERLCVPPSTACPGELCGLGASYTVCLASPTATTCPSVAPHMRQVGTGFTLDCGTTCGCTPTATCNATFTYYPDNGCGNGGKTLQAGQCTAVDNSAQSIKVNVSVGNQTCGPTVTPGTAKLTLTQATPGIICCP